MIDVGDLVVCVDAASRYYTIHNDLVEGRIYRVLGIRLWDDGSPNLILDPNETWGSRADRFRKICPDELTECEEEFRILLKLSKQRAKEGANAACGGTALSSLRDEACCASSPFGFQSTFVGGR